MIIAGLTGGIATGKSTVASMFKRTGTAIVDADLIAKEAVRQGRPAWQDIVDHFGPGILMPDGGINRKKLGDIIFRNDEQKKILDQIVHPYVFDSMEEQIRLFRRKNEARLLLLDIPLFFESGRYTGDYDSILVFIPRELQLLRLMKRDRISRKDALARINSQMPIEQKRDMADYIIYNDESMAETEKQVLDLYALLQKQGKI